MRTLTQKAPFFHRWPFRVRYRRPAENPPNTLREMAKIHTKGRVSWKAGGMGQPPEPVQIHLPHEHEEEAGGGHESSPAGGRQHPKHGHNCGGQGGRTSQWLTARATAPRPHPRLADRALGRWGKMRLPPPSQQHTPFHSTREDWVLAGLQRGAAAAGPWLATS